MSFSIESGRENKPSFLDIKVSLKEGKLTIPVYLKPTFDGMYRGLHLVDLLFINLLWFKYGMNMFINSVYTFAQIRHNSIQN